MIDSKELQHKWLTKIKTLNSTLWNDRAKFPVIQRWLNNFQGAVFEREVEQMHALHLLQQFMVFGEVEIHELLKVIYRDLFRYPLIQEIRNNLGSNFTAIEIGSRYNNALLNTRFLGLGRAGESGQHLIYTFRQFNNLPLDLVSDANSLFTFSNGKDELAAPMLSHVVFIDDISGSGTQAKDRLTPVISRIKALRPECKIYYFPLFATTQAIEVLKGTPGLDVIKPAMELDPAYSCYHDKSIYFRDVNDDGQTMTASKAVMQAYGESICRGNGLGFGECQLLLSFHHNTPDNTLPVFWFNEQPAAWSPIFPRHPKTAINPAIL